jgi:hypothetical protein
MALCSCGDLRIGEVTNYNTPVRHSIRGYLSSLNTQGVKRLAALETVFTGQPFSPTLSEVLLVW